MSTPISSNRPAGPNYSGTGNTPGNTPAGPGSTSAPLPPLAHEDPHAKGPGADGTGANGTGANGTSPRSGDVLRGGGAPSKDLYLYDFPDSASCQLELQKRMLNDQKTLQIMTEIAKLPKELRDKLPAHDLKDFPTSSKVNCDPDVALRKQAELQQQLKQLQQQLEIQKSIQGNLKKVQDQIR
jgi:hypothetical protein